ncbi:PREDICTED: mimitin, mitochondrial [Ceratosolen solmsi marchali]|uniref:Mimitin, mitochondrial n=1 Tax=Ceratosolen solmsi marchali TaxID=326594 RepID=A0AAJ7DZM4_9HYME|nr:PREDICTED: mimitin, mitochondrial [Ceratosolen solmsi marchali]
MVRKEKGLFRMMFYEFIEYIKPNFPKTTCVGTDHFGTKYYETINSKSTMKKIRRYFTPLNKTDFEQELPAEWEAWLRYRRKIPPTEKEVNDGYQMILTKRKNAAKLNATFSNYLSDSKSNKDQSSTTHANLKYPVYEDYKKYS